MNIRDFCKKYRACADGYERNKHFKDMQDFFENSEQYDDVIWATCQVLNEKDRIRFACWCVRQIWHLLKDKRSRKVIEVAEAYCEDKATKEELMIARSAAYYAAYADSDAYAAAAAYYAAHAAAYAAYDTVCAANAAAYAVAYAAHAANDAANAAARKAQVTYLRENFKPDWEKIY